MVVKKRQSPLRLTRFTYQNNSIDMCKSCPYLRTIMSNYEQFKLSINKLYKNARRQMYNLLGNLNKLHAENVKFRKIYLIK